MQTVGQLIRAQRRTLGLTLRALASLAGCTPGYLSEVENEKRPAPPSEELLARLESALEMQSGTLREVAEWQTTPRKVKRRLHNIEARQQRARDALHNMMGSGALDDAYEAGVLRELFGDPETPDRAARPDDGVTGAGLPVQIPLINSVQAGYPREFTDLGYPVRIADEYIAVPGVSDADAFAARVVGDSMAPDYREGDIVVFSPSVETSEGSDCFARLEHPARRPAVR